MEDCFGDSSPVFMMKVSIFYYSFHWQTAATNGVIEVGGTIVPYLYRLVLLLLRIAAF